MNSLGDDERLLRSSAAVAHEFDSHAAGFDGFGPDKMTRHGSKMLPWSLEKSG